MQQFSTIPYPEKLKYLREKKFCQIKLGLDYNRLVIEYVFLVKDDNVGCLFLLLVQ